MKYNSIHGSSWYITINVWKIYNGKIEVAYFVKEAGRKLIISVNESKIKGFSLCNSFVFDNVLYKLCLIGVKEMISKERDTVCSHGGDYGLLKNVP